MLGVVALECGDICKPAPEKIVKFAKNRSVSRTFVTCYCYRTPSINPRLNGDPGLVDSEGVRMRSAATPDACESFVAFEEAIQFVILLSGCLVRGDPL